MSVASISSPEPGYGSNRILAHLPFIAGVQIDLVDKKHPDRQRVENYIREKFRQRYGANVNSFLPELLTLSCKQRLCAVVGIRMAEKEPLYLENYLDAPVEQEIGFHFKTAIPRLQIIEIGNLVSTWRGSSQLLFVCLTDLLARVEREWVAFTATHEVEQLLKKMNFTLVHLADAALDKVEQTADQWGSYYEDKPKVMFGHVPSAMAILKQHSLMVSSLSLFSEQIEETSHKWLSRHV